MNKKEAKQLALSYIVMTVRSADESLGILSETQPKVLEAIENELDKMAEKAGGDVYTLVNGLDFGGEGGRL